MQLSLLFWSPVSVVSPALLWPCIVLNVFSKRTGIANIINSKPPVQASKQASK